MASSLDDGNLPGDHMEDLQDCLEDSSLSSLMRIDSNERRLSVNLDAVSRGMLQSLSASPSTCLKDRALLDSLPLASTLLVESIRETENSLSRDFTAQELDKKLSLWKSSLEPWHELLKKVKNLGTVPAPSIQGLLDFVPEIIQTVFTHCKRSESLYGPKFDDLLPQLTGLFRQTSSVLDLFFSILGSNVEFEDKVKTEKNPLNTVLEKIGEIAVLTNGMDLKTQLNTWKAFAKLGATHDVILKKLDSTSCITGRYVDMAKDIQGFLFDSLEVNKETNYERGIKCAAMLLKILVRLCTLYRGYCGNKVFIVLVQLLTKLHRYFPPFTSERFIHAHLMKIGECLAIHIEPAIGELLNVVVDENEFREAFFEYGKSELEDRPYYHLLTLRIMEELLKRQPAGLSLWMQQNGSIIDVALANANYCCEDLLIDTMRIPIRSQIASGDLQHLGIYQATLRLLCQSIARTSAEDFGTIEIALLKHLLSGEFWSCLLSCDCWTYLARIAPPNLCAEHLSFLIKVQKSLTTRENSLEFGILSHLIGRLYKSFSTDKSSTREEIKFIIFREIEDYTNRKLVDPLRKYLPARARQYLWQQSTVDTTNKLSTIFQELHRSPSVRNWTRLTSLLRSIGALAISKDERPCTETLRTIWSFITASVPKSAGVTRDMLLELTTLLLDCTQPDCDKSSNNDWAIASIYKSMVEVTEHLPIQHRIRMNVFIRENLESFANATGKQSFSSITELFCCLVSDENPWVRQESFETYAEHILKSPSSELFDSISIGISKLPRINRQLTSYFSNTKIHDLTHYSSLNNYLRDLAESSRDRSTRHECYEPTLRVRDEKMPRLEVESLDKRIVDICDELENIVKRKNDLSSGTADRLRLVLIKLLEPS